MSSDSYDKKRVPASQRLMSQEASIVSDGTLVPLELDGQKLTVEPGTTILDAARQVGIAIPTLCTHEDLCVVGNCRICVVEVDGYSGLQAACAYPITEPLVVRSHSSQIRNARRHMLELILAHHTGDCYACNRNENCELSSLAADFGVDSIRFQKNQRIRTIDNSSMFLSRDMNKCVLCRRCVRACIDMQEVGVMEAVGKGDTTEIETFGNKPLSEVVCIGCGQCVSRCPTAALYYLDETRKVWDAIEDPSTHVVIQLSTSVRAAILETIGFSPGTVMCGQLVSLLHAMGFDKVFDTQLAVGLAVTAQVRQLLTNIFMQKKSKSTGLTNDAGRIIFSSNSSGWVRYMEHFVPSYLKYLSPLKSPEQLLGTLLRAHYAHCTDVDESSIISVAAVPCAAKKSEAEMPLARTNGYKNVDVCITTRELGKMIKESGIQLSQLGNRPFDDIVESSGMEQLTPFNSMLHLLSGLLYQALTGEELTSDVKVQHVSPFGIPGAYIMKIPIVSTRAANTFCGEKIAENFTSMEGNDLVFGKCEGTANAKKVIEDIANGGVFSTCHYIEFLACPDGCYGGGGQPVPTNRRIRQSRKEMFPAINSFLPSQRRFFAQLYEQCASGELIGNITGNSLFTSYTPRGKFIK